MGTTLSDYRPADRAGRTRTGRALYGRVLTLGLVGRYMGTVIRAPTGH